MFINLFFFTLISLSNLWKSGLIHYWKEKYYLDMLKNHHDDYSKPPERENNINELILIQLKSVFISYIFGICLAIIVLFIELIIINRNKMFILLGNTVFIKYIINN